MVATQIFFIFTPIPGEMIQFDEHIFQLGGSTTNQISILIKPPPGFNGKEGVFSWLSWPHRTCTQMPQFPSAKVGIGHPATGTTEGPMHYAQETPWSFFKGFHARKWFPLKYVVSKK